jgi:hypothetical protein
MLWEHLDQFCKVYLLEIIVYLNSLEEDREHVRHVLIKILEAGL